jgi:hypothetical protein
MPYQINPHVVWIEDRGEIRLYDPLAGEFRTLNRTAVEIWHLATAGNTTREIVEAMLDRYPEPDPRHRNDVANGVVTFLAELALQGLLVPSPPDTDVLEPLMIAAEAANG